MSSGVEGGYCFWWDWVAFNVDLGVISIAVEVVV